MSATPKYELTGDPNELGLRRIRALRDIVRWGVKAGDLGGWILSVASLTHDGDAWVSGDAQVLGNAWVHGDAQVYGDARVSGNAWVYGDAQVSGNAWVHGDARVLGNARVFGDAQVSKRNDCGWFSMVGSEHGTLTWFRTDAGVSVTRGCFAGTLDQFERRVAERHGSEQIAREYSLLIQFIRLRAGVDAPAEEAA